MTDTHNPKGWPRGAGSLQRRGRVLWLIYRDTRNNVCQESTGTEDLKTARGMLAAKAIATLEARIAKLKRFTNASEAEGHGDAGTGRSGSQAKDRRGPQGDAQDRAGNSQGETR